MAKKTKISDSAAVVLLRKLINRAVEKGVVLRPGDYIDPQHIQMEKKDEEGTVWHTEKRVNFACALGSIEHALARGKKLAPSWNDHKSLLKKVNHGITVQQLSHLEAGFEGEYIEPCDDNYVSMGAVKVNRKNPLYKLGAQLRKRAFKVLREKQLPR